MRCPQDVAEFWARWAPRRCCWAALRAWPRPTGVQGTGSRSATIALMALAMGVRNTMARKLAVPDLATTMLTMTLAGLASESSLAGSPNIRTGRRIAAVAALFLGACVGAMLLRGYGAGWALLATVGCVVLTGIGYAVAERLRHSARPKADRR
ncbi:YoaK family protein [Streptomyces sp. NPDC054933]